jgi:hypothetical protein
MSGAERLPSNNRVRILEERVLSDDWYILKKTTFEYRCRDGRWQRQSRETYDRGNGAVLLSYNVERSTVVLIRQFRFPTFVNGCDDGLLIEACAGRAPRDLQVSGLNQSNTCSHAARAVSSPHALIMPGSRVRVPPLPLCFQPLTLTHSQSPRMCVGG